MALFYDLTDAEKNCRICLSKRDKNSLVSLTATVYALNDTTGLGKNVKILDVLNLLTQGLLENEQHYINYPKLICNDCLPMINEMIKLKIQLDNSTTILNGLSRIGIKNEETKSSTIDKTTSNDDDSDDIDNNDHDSNDDEENCQVSNSDNEKDDLTIKSELNDNEETEIKYNGDDNTGKPMLHPCPVCMENFTALALRQHIRSHDSFKNYLDISVGEGVTFYETSSKKVTIYNRKEKLHLCPFCEETLPIEQFRQHVDNHRLDENFKCDLCDRVFRKQRHLKCHKNQHLKELPYKCQFCNKGFVMEKNYNCHMSLHTKDELPYECDQCEKKFFNPEHLYRHKFIHTQSVPYYSKYKINRCRKCRLTFKTVEQLQEHSSTCQKKVILGGKGSIMKQRVQCKLCPKSFAQKSGLYTHMQLKHLGIQRKILCQVCGAYTTQFKRHMMMHNNIRPFKCEYCQKQFTDKSVLVKHLMIHTGERPFMCTKCGKTFNKEHNLKMHERIHVGIKNHVCEICDRAFLEAAYLRKHMKIHWNKQDKTDSKEHREGDESGDTDSGEQSQNEMCKIEIQDNDLDWDYGEN